MTSERPFPFCGNTPTELFVVLDSWLVSSWILTVLHRVTTEQAPPFGGNTPNTVRLLVVLVSWWVSSCILTVLHRVTTEKAAAFGGNTPSIVICRVGQLVSSCLLTVPSAVEGDLEANKRRLQVKRKFGKPSLVARVSETVYNNYDYVWAVNIFGEKKLRSFLVTFVFSPFKHGFKTVCRPILRHTHY